MLYICTTIIHKQQPKYKAMTTTSIQNVKGFNIPMMSFAVSKTTGSETKVMVFETKNLRGEDMVIIKLGYESPFESVRRSDYRNFQDMLIIKNGNAEIVFDEDDCRAEEHEQYGYTWVAAYKAANQPAPAAPATKKTICRRAVMVRAHQIAKGLQGDRLAIMSAAMKQAWAEAKAA